MGRFLWCQPALAPLTHADVTTWAINASADGGKQRAHRPRSHYMGKQYGSTPVWWNRPENVVTAKNDPILWLNDSETTEKLTDDTPDTPPTRQR
ncbi:hypothetical protein GBS0709_03890 [Edwardsiella tarda]|nr:hypothetical protein GBS0709_03890 [Edwardsiella tarda]GAC65308.1 hypothetical protein ET1_15_01160 [Edwardsiella tarda ATCC 15947 = NBRC 105688]